MKSGRKARRGPRIGLLAGALLLSWGCAREPEVPLDRAAGAISDERVENAGRSLADEDLAGRYYASPEADTAAAMLLRRLRALQIPLVQRSENLLGRHPASFVHHFSVTLYRLGSHTRLSAVHAGTERAAELRTDFVPLVFSRNEDVVGRVVRLGPDSPPARSLAGAVAVVMVPTARPPDAELYARVRALQERGAAGVLFSGDGRLLNAASAVYPSHLSAEQRAVADSPRGLAANLNADRLSLAAQAQIWRDAPARTIPAIAVRGSWADRLQNGDVVRLQVDHRPEVSLAQNVLVGFRGTRAADEVLVLAANYDHAGVNAAGEVLNGANDNTSGVAALLEVAAALAAVRTDLQRSVVIAFFSASRAGLQGSEMLLHDWPLLFGPAARPTAMLALRGVGRDDGNPLLVVGGNRFDDLAAALERYDTRATLLGPVLAVQRHEEETNDVARIEIVPSRGSDHLSFQHAGIPAVLLTGGMEPGGLPDPADDWRHVDSAKVARVARLVFRASLDLANTAAPGVMPARSSGR